MKNIKICVLMDNIQNIKPHKDTSFAIMLAAQKKNWAVYQLNQKNLFFESGIPTCLAQRTSVIDKKTDFFSCEPHEKLKLTDFDVILIRTDPPFDQEYMYSCHLLALAEQKGTLVLNKPSALCQFNEKLFIGQFPELCAPTLVSKQSEPLIAFLNEHRDIILKPLDGMGGASIFRLKHGDKNTNVIIETLSKHNTEFVMAQRFIPDIKNGDKRILIVDGKPVDYALARIPSQGENRGNLAAGGRGIGQPLSKRDRLIAETVAPVLTANGILFAGIDVIGDYLTEINITSPTCVRELDEQFGLDIAGDFINVIESKLQSPLQ